MRRMSTLKILVVCLMAITPGQSLGLLGSKSDATIQTAFDRNCEQLVIKAIKEADDEIVGAIYTFTRRSIANALINASDKGVDVELKLDMKQAEWDGTKTLIRKMRAAGIKVTRIRMEKKGTHMHHKFIVVDEEIVVTGSYNYTTSATTENNENAIRVESRDAADAYIEAYESINSCRKR